jgi:hypothetical protein
VEDEVPVDEGDVRGAVGVGAVDEVVADGAALELRRVGGKDSVAPTTLHTTLRKVNAHATRRQRVAGAHLRCVADGDVRLDGRALGLRALGL